MDINPIQRSIDASDIAPERLAGNSQLTEQQKVAEATRQFEAILLRQILQNAQKTVIPSALTDDSTTGSIYRDLVTNQLAESISKSGTLGLGNALAEQFARQVPSALAGPDREMEALPTARPASDDVRPSFHSHPARHTAVPGTHHVSPPPSL